MTSRALSVLIGMTLFACFYNAFFPAHFDEIYYWDWSRHLGLSYYDGPPLIAYSIKLATSLLGNTAFALKCVSVAYLSGTAFLIYRFTNYLFKDTKIAAVALVLTLFWPLLQGLYLAATPDSPLLFFWIATLYSFYLAIEKNKVRYFYLTGLCAGLLLLSKYNGILLLGALFAYLLFSKHRKQFSNPHLYLSALLTLLLFSPVILWNAQHDWISFTFQWGHGVAQQKIFQPGLMAEFLSGQIGLLNPVFSILFIVLTLVHRRDFKTDARLYFLCFPFALPFLFFFYNACFTHAEANWPAACYLSVFMILGYWIVHYHHRKIYHFGIVFAICVIGLLKIIILFPFQINDFGFSDHFRGYKEMIEQATPLYEAYHRPVVISDFIYNAGSSAFYLPGQPEVYILDPLAHSQYRYWNSEIKKTLPTQALYIGEAVNVSTAASLYFKHCKKLKNLFYQEPHGKPKSMAVFYCEN